MKRKKQFIRNILLIITFVFVSYFFSGQYLSVERCVEDTLESLYKPKAEILFQSEEGVYMFNEKLLRLYSLRLRKQGPFYQTTSISEFTFDSNEKNFSTHISFRNDTNLMYVMAYRFNPYIDHIDIYYNNEIVGVLNDWNENLAVTEIKEIIPYEYQCLAYDDSNRLIEEKQLLGEE